jgi:aryl-alcohol dehydrogenase-like predicted oxidoreductase
MAQIALAWLPSKPAVACRSLVPPTPSTCRKPVVALEIRLAQDETAALEEPYLPQDSYWW